MSTNKAKLEALLKLINSAARRAITEYEKVGEDVPSIESTGPHPMDDAIDNITLKNAVRTLEGACAQLCTILAPPSHTIMNLVNVYDYACIRVALQERITNILVDYPQGIHVDELSTIVKIDPKKLARLLRLLATKGCYDEVELDTFANNRLSLILRSDNPVSHLADVHIEQTDKCASVFYETLKDPETAYSEDPKHAPRLHARNKEAADPFYNWVGQEDARRKRFYYAMRGLDTIMNCPAFLNSSLVDVGGGTGAFSMSLAKIHKHIVITLHDLPEVLDQARNVWARECPEEVQENRIEFSTIDFLSQAPIRGKDIYYLRAILHNWPDKEALCILRNLRQALGSHSRILIHDHIVRGLIRRQAVAEASSLGTTVAPEPMLPNFGVGHIRRTLQNSLQLAKAAGLKLEKVWDLVDTCVLEYSAA